MPIPCLHLSLTLDGERGTNLCGSAGRDLCRATPEESLEVAGYAEQLEPQAAPEQQEHRQSGARSA
jgi:hypothetical protein